MKFLLNKCSWKFKSLPFLREKLCVAWVRIGFLLAPYWKKSNCSSLKIFRIKLTVSIYGGKVTSNSIERLRPVTHNTTLSISFPQNVRLRPYPCSTCSPATRRTSEEAAKPVAFASPCFSRVISRDSPQIWSLLELQATKTYSEHICLAFYLCQIPSSGFLNSCFLFLLLSNHSCT